MGSSDFIPEENEELISCSKIMGPEGGTFTVNGHCDVIIPKDALTRDVEIVATVITPIFDSSTTSVTPTIKMEPSGLNFQKPITMRLYTWRGLRFQNSSQSVTVVRKSGCLYSQQDVSLNSSRSVEFKTEHFTFFRADLPDEIARVYISNYVFYDSEQKEIVFYFGFPEDIGSYKDNLPLTYKCVSFQDKLAVDLGSVLTCSVDATDGVAVAPEKFTVEIKKQLIKQNRIVKIKQLSGVDPDNIDLMYTIELNSTRLIQKTLQLASSPITDSASITGSRITRTESSNSSFRFSENVNGKSVNIGNGHVSYHKHYNTNEDVQYEAFKCQNCSSDIADGKDLADIRCDVECRRERQTICGKPKVWVHSVKNPRGYCFNIVTFDKISEGSCDYDSDEATSWETWFFGYEWIVCYCYKCKNHVGWKYVSDKDQFFGIITEKLKRKSTLLDEY